MQLQFSFFELFTYAVTVSKKSELFCYAATVFSPELILHRYSVKGYMYASFVSFVAPASQGIEISNTFVRYLVSRGTECDCGPYH